MCGDVGKDFAVKSRSEGWQKEKKSIEGQGQLSASRSTVASTEAFSQLLVSLWAHSTTECIVKLTHASIIGSVTPALQVLNQLKKVVAQ